MFQAAPSTDVTMHTHWRKVRGGADFEAFGMPLNVLIGGSPAMIGAIWDVLGGDLEQLVCCLLGCWILGEQQQSRSPASMLAALSKARKACKLRFLTGAAV